MGAEASLAWLMLTPSAGIAECRQVEDAPGPKIAARVTNLWGPKVVPHKRNTTASSNVCWKTDVIYFPLRATTVELNFGRVSIKL